MKDGECRKRDHTAPTQWNKKKKEEKRLKFLILYEIS